MTDPGSAAASTSQSKRGRGFLTDLKKKLDPRQKSKDHDSPASQRDVAIHRGKELAVRNHSGTDLVANGRSTEIEEPVQSSKSVSTIEPTVVTARDSPVKVKEIAQAPERVSIADLTVLSTSELFAETRKTPQPSDCVLAVEPLGPIHELWNEAYDELRKQEERLVKDYESALREDPAMMLGSTVTLSGSKLERKAQMKALLARKVDEVKKNTWKLKFGGHDVALKDLAEPVVGIVQWADDYISGALSANPYASIAWGGVSLLLPLVLNPSKQAASLATGLAKISDLIVRSTMREDLYERRYGSHGHDEDQKTFISSHLMYRDTLKALYVQILKFQASSICYMSKNGAFRIGLDMIKWDNWDSSLSNIQEREEAFLHVYAIWKDIRDQKDCEALFTQHQEKMRVMTSILGDVSGLREAVEKAQRDTERTGLLNWLSSTDPSEFFNLGLDKLRADTGSWLLDGNGDFESWQTSPNSFAWLNGKAGSGKSVLSSSIIKYLKERNDSNPKTALAFFYFSFTDERTQNVIEMLCSLIRQICCRRPNTPQSVQSLIDYKGKGHRPDRRTLEHILVDTIRGFSTVHVVLDALDECPSENNEREKLLESLSRIRIGGSQNLHLLCTSRRVADIEAVLKPMASSGSNLDIDLSAQKRAVDHDIGLHIDKTFNTEPFMSWSHHIQTEAKAALIDRADGMFQYVACQFDSLRRHRAPAKIQEVLRDLPKGLDATYDRMLQGIDPEYQKQVAGVLKWLAFSFRPLFVGELAEIFILDYEKPVPFDEKDRFSTVEDVLTYLSGLVTKVPEVDRYYLSFSDRSKFTEIRFAHFSIKEYLTSTRIADKVFFTQEQTAHLHISESCLAYHLQLSKSILATKDTLRQYALWDYVARNLVDHLERLDDESWTTSVTSHAKRIFVAKSQNLLNLIRISNPDHYYEIDLEKDFDSLASPLYYAVSMGAFQLTSQLIRDGADINERSLGRHGTALGVAAFGGNKTMVELLLEKGADVNEQDGDHGNALQAAAEQTGNQGIVQLLLDKGADVNAQGGYYGTALQAATAAARYGSLEVVQLLLDKGADVNAQGGYYRTALQAAAANGHQKVVRLLLDSSADVNAQGGCYGTALQAATANGDQKVVQLLLDKGADVDAQGGEYGTALQAAALYGIQEVVQLLLDKGADVNAQGGYYRTALQAAAANGHQKVVRLLLDSSADVNAQGGCYGTALQAATANGDQKVVQLLLDKGADVDAQGGEYGTALQAAALYGIQEVVQLLLDKGADVNAQGGYYRTALQAEAANGHQKVVRLLLDRSADVNAQGGCYGTALQAATANGDQKVVQLLLDKGADVNAQGGEYGTALQAAALYGNQEVVQLLLDKGADVNAQGGYYGTVLQAEAANGHQKVVRLLLDRSADVNAQGGCYGTALQAATANGDQKVVQLLLDKGADVNAQGGEYGTALQAAALYGNLEVVQLLLDKGADIHVKGGIYGNALQAAIADDKLDTAELLLAQGAGLDPPGTVWEELLAQVEEKVLEGKHIAQRLREYRENPSGYVDRRRQELESYVTPLNSYFL